MDAVSIYIIPLGALVAAVMFFWICPKGYAREQIQMGREKKGWKMAGAGYEVCICRHYICGLCFGNFFWRNRLIPLGKVCEK